MPTEDEDEAAGPRTTTTEIIATFDPPWKWDDLGLRLHDSPNGVVLDHIAVRSRAAEVDGLRIGIQCVRVNRFPTEGKGMAEITRIIRSREEEQERLMLKFVNISKVGLNGFTGSRIMDHGFVINPVAKTKSGDSAADTFDVEEGGGGEKRRTNHKVRSKTKTKEQKRLEQLEQTEARSRAVASAFEIEGTSQVVRWTPVCAPWETFIYWAHEQARLDLIQVVCFIGTRNPAALACAVSLCGAGMVAADNKGDTAGWSAVCKLDRPYRVMLRNHIICTLVAIPVGVAMQLYELLALPESQPWWCVWIARDELSNGLLVLEGSHDTNMTGSESSGIPIEPVDENEVDLSVCSYNQECPYCSGEWPIWYIVLAWIIMVLELYFRCTALAKALKGRKRISSWADREQEVLHRCASLLQAKTRGRQARRRIAEVCLSFQNSTVALVFIRGVFIVTLSWLLVVRNTEWSRVLWQGSIACAFFTARIISWTKRRRKYWHCGTNSAGHRPCTPSVRRHR